MKFTSKRVAVETTEGHLVEERANPRGSFAGPWRVDGSQRGKRMSWEIFLRSHWGAIAAADFFSAEVLTMRGQEGLNLVGAVSQESTTTVRLQLNGSTASGGASAYCSFTYETSAP
jgi:hypothetical protein